MNCPKCKHYQSRVLDSSRSLDGSEWLRRRQCRKCAHRWTTRELDAQRLTSRIPPSVRSIAQKQPHN